LHRQRKEIEVMLVEQQLAGLADEVRVNMIMSLALY
jgi:hypothetical protein